MRIGSLVVALLWAAAGAAASATAPGTVAEPSRQIARELAAAALDSDLAYRLTRSLTTEIGPRLAGTAQEARAREWAVRELTRLGFDDVRVEDFPLQLWTRGESVYEAAAIVAPYPQPLHAISLGGAGATPEQGLEAEIAYFASFDDLAASDDAEDALTGRLAFVDDRMTASRTGEGYGWANRKRQGGWLEAEARGAAGLLIRSVGTSSHRFAHTGMMSFPEGRQAAIPALAISAPDADQIRRIHEQGEKVRVRLRTRAGWRGEATSGNVIAEVRGAGAPEEIVIIGAHLDSWDTGTGALDDGAGVGIVTAAAHLIRALPRRPRRTIRVVLFGAEEVGLVGARAYAAARAEDGTLQDHVIGSESDFGAREVWRLSTNVAEHALPFFEDVHRELAPLGIIRGGNDASGGPDMYPLQMAGMPVVRLDQNGEDYFDYHHTPDDTFDKIDPGELAQNVAAWALLVWLVADSDQRFRP